MKKKFRRYKSHLLGGMTVTLAGATLTTVTPHGTEICTGRISPFEFTEVREVHHGMNLVLTQKRPYVRGIRR